MKVMMTMMITQHNAIAKPTKQHRVLVLVRVQDVCRMQDAEYRAGDARGGVCTVGGDRQQQLASSRPQLPPLPSFLLIPQPTPQPTSSTSTFHPTTFLH